jgi:hypothetical protein
MKSMKVMKLVTILKMTKESTMEAFGRERRRRYVRADSGATVTPLVVEAVRAAAELDIAISSQIAAYLGVSQKSANRRIRAAFDAGLVDIIPAPRALLGQPGSPMGPELLYGSAPNLVRLSASGAKALHRLGILAEARIPKELTPRSALFLAHSLLGTDVRLWLLRAARASEDEELASWMTGERAAIELGRTGFPARVVPDARFTYTIGDRVLSCAVEVDRGSERGDFGSRWAEKCAAYAELFTGGRMKELTGFSNMRLLVTVPGPLRRDNLAQYVAKASSAVAERAWFAVQSGLAGPTLRAAVWRRSGIRELVALL